MNNTSSATQRPTRMRWVMFCLAFFTSWMLYVHRYAFALFKPAIKEEFGLDNVQLGLLDSGFSLFYSWSQFPIGMATDALGVRFILPILIIVWSLGLAMHAWAPSFGMLHGGRIALGIGQSAVLANISRVARNWFATPIRTTLQGLAGVAASRLGGVGASLIVGSLMLGYFGLQWRTAVYILAGIGIVHGIVFFVWFRNTPAEHPGVNDAEAKLLGDEKSSTVVEPAKADGEPAPKMSKLQLLRSLKPRALINLVCLNIQSILSTFADNIFSAWIPLFLFETYALKYKEMGFNWALPLLGGALGGFVGGALNDWIIRKTGNKRWTRSGVACFGKGMAAVVLFIAVIWWFDSPYVFCGFLFFVKLFGDMSLSTSWGVVTDIGGKATASVFAFNNSIAGIGAISAPIVYGFLSREFDWKVVFMTAGCAYILCAISWLFVNCTIPIVDESKETNETNV